jgi:hypothetical protein
LSAFKLRGCFAAAELARGVTGRCWGQLTWINTLPNIETEY